MILQRNDIVETIKIFTEKHDPFDRYASYDYCFNYFHPANKNCITDDMEKSCLSLGFYLASWGMYRGSSFLLNKSALVFVPLIEYISELDDNVWEIDANNLNDNFEQTIEIYRNLKSLLIPKETSHLTLIVVVKYYWTLYEILFQPLQVATHYCVYGAVFDCNSSLSSNRYP